MVDGAGLIACMMYRFESYCPHHIKAHWLLLNLTIINIENLSTVCFYMVHRALFFVNYPLESNTYTVMLHEESMCNALWSCEMCRISCFS